LQATQDPWIYSPLFWVFVSGAALACLAGIFKEDWSRHMVTLSAFSVLTWVTNPLSNLDVFKPETNSACRTIAE
jgi:uncharacterized membrane protein YjjP (DUF1212 family)